jgi:1,4-dihydroxy-2-naphthoyl-CoA hydrolase
MKPIWFKPYTLADLDKLRPKTLIAHLDITFTEIGPDFIAGRMPVNEHVHQIAGVLHGGASVVLAETLGSLGAGLAIDNEKQFCVGQEINANHLRSIASGDVIGIARPFHIGATSHVWGIEIRDERDKLVCVSRLTVAVRDKP